MTLDLGKNSLALLVLFGADDGLILVALSTSRISKRSYRSKSSFASPFRHFEEPGQEVPQHDVGRQI